MFLHRTGTSTLVRRGVRAPILRLKVAKTAGAVKRQLAAGLDLHISLERGGALTVFAGNTFSVERSIG